MIRAVVLIIPSHKKLIARTIFAIIHDLDRFLIPRDVYQRVDIWARGRAPKHPLQLQTHLVIINH